MITEISYPLLDKLIQTTKLNYPKGKVYDTRVEMGEVGIKRARLSYFDALSTSYQFNPAGIDPTNTAQSILNGYRFGLVLNVGALLQKPAYVKLAKKELEIAQFEKGSFDLNLEAMVKERYFIYVQRVTILKLISGALFDVESMLKQVRYKFEKGEETLESYNRILLQYSTQVQSKISAESEVLIAKSSLEELLGKKLEDVK